MAIMIPYRLVRPLLFRLRPERAHALAMGLLAGVQGTPLEGALRRRYRVDDDRLAVETMGLAFPNPVGVAAGLDKNARAPHGLAALGFGHLEVGGVTATPQTGNPRPRLFRLPEDRALINRMGFNNDGADVVGRRLAALGPPDVPLGVNVGKSKDVPPAEAPADYAATYRQVGPHADYVVVNVSSPNTPGLRALQDRTHLEAILGRLREAGAAPLLVKLSPDLATETVDEAIAVVEDLDLDGIVAVNTTVDRPADLRGDHAEESGGLSGAPLEGRATDLVRHVATRTDVPIVGVGGIADAADAYRKIRNGAHVVQLYTALIYEGPALARRTNEGLLARIERDGFDSIEDAIGADL